MGASQTICLYGDTGTFKTTQAARLAALTYEETGRVTRLISADGGGWGHIDDYVSSGVIEPFSVLTLSPETVTSAVARLCGGFWPAEVTLGRVTRWLEPKPATWEHVGGYIFEGITTVSQLILRAQVAAGRKIAEDVVSQFTEDGVKFGAPARAHYNFVQQYIADRIQALSGLPVQRVVMTAHSGKGQDQMTKQLVYGPAAVGSAMTDRIPPMVQDLWHFDVAAEAGLRGAVTTSTRAYFRPHPDDQTKVPWPAKLRLHPHLVARLNAVYPGGFIDLTDPERGVDDYYRLRVTLEAERAASLAAWKEKVDAGRGVAA